MKNKQNKTLAMMQTVRGCEMKPCQMTQIICVDQVHICDRIGEKGPRILKKSSYYYRREE